jgi:hypothetical protein
LLPHRNWLKFRGIAGEKLSAPQKSGDGFNRLWIALADGFNAWDAFSAIIQKPGEPELMKKPEKPKRKGRKPAEGASDKRQFLTTMDPDVIKAIKMAAIEEDMSGSEVLEEAAKQWLERRKSKQS